MFYRTARDIFIKEGPTKFFAGYMPSLFLSFHGVIQMYSYENINYFFGFQSG